MIGKHDEIDMIRQRTDPWWEVRAEVLNAWINMALPTLDRGFVLKTDLFDEACGPYHHAEIAEKIGKILGIDRSLAVVKASKERLEKQAIKARFIVCDVRALPFQAESVSTVLSLSTLDHFDKKEDILISLREISRVMKQGGILFLTLDNPQNPSNALRAILPKRFTSKLRADTFPIGVTLNKHEAESSFRAAGFEIHQSSWLIHGFRYLMIRVLKYLQREGYTNLLQIGMSVIRKLEMLRSLPTRAFSGHYSAWLLEKS